MNRRALLRGKLNMVASTISRVEEDEEAIRTLTWLGGSFFAKGRRERFALDTWSEVGSPDAVNWALGAQPQSAFGSGGRQVYTDPELFGNIFDHFECRFTYADGQRVHAMCRNWPGDAKHSEMVVGTAG